MVWEPFYNREYSVTDFNDINRAYNLIRKVASSLPLLSLGCYKISKIT